MTGENEVRISARFICSAAALSAWRTISVVTGSAPIDVSAMSDDKGSGRMDLGRVAGVEVGRGGRLGEDGRAGQDLARRERGPRADREAQPLLAGERPGVDRAPLAVAGLGVRR